MKCSDFGQPFRFATRPHSLASSTDKGPGCSEPASQIPSELRKRYPSVFVFNPFAEGYIAYGRRFTPVKHQGMLAQDLANLPQFLCDPGDIVLSAKRPSVAFLACLGRAGFSPPEFVELGEGRLDPAGDLCNRQLGSLRPWAWGPDSLSLFEPLFAHSDGGVRVADQYFNRRIARLYSKSWSADLLRKALSLHRGERTPASTGAEAETRLVAGGNAVWLCAEEEAGVVVDTLAGALGAIAAIRSRGHHRVVVKQGLGLAGHNAIRFWEAEILPAQRRWLDHALEQGQQLVVEPWLERELDFSVQLEMAPQGLKLCGYTGLLNDRRGQFLGNWAEAEYRSCLPSGAAALFPAVTRVSERFRKLYEGIFSILEAELRGVGFLGPVSIDALIYRTSRGGCRLKPVVEINPRYTMGRLTLELMNHVCAGSSGRFRLVNRAQARAEGFAELLSYARGLSERRLLVLEGDHVPKIREGALCLNDPEAAQAALATFEVSRTPALPGCARRT